MIICAAKQEKKNWPQSNQITNLLFPVFNTCTPFFFPSSRPKEVCANTRTNESKGKMEKLLLLKNKNKIKKSQHSNGVLVPTNRFFFPPLISLKLKHQLGICTNQFSLQKEKKITEKRTNIYIYILAKNKTWLNLL